MDEEEFKKQILEELKDLVEARTREIALVTPVDTGYLKSTVSSEMDKDFASIYVTASYAPYVHYKGRPNDYFSEVLLDDSFLEKL